MKYCFIFDLDGLLVDTQLPFHAVAESMIFARHGLNLKPEVISQRYAGISTRKIFHELLPRENVDMLVQQKWETMYKLLKTNSLIALPGMLDVCYFLKSQAIPIIIASASPKSWIQLCLNQPMIDPKLANNFTSVNFSNVFGNNFVSAEECRDGKPAPDVFLLAKNRLAVSSLSETIKWVVVGDGASDVVGGLAAGMEVLFLSDINTDFDSNQRVKRFSDSMQLAEYIRKLVVND
jgi:beta-phosphoglucomutase-like phosphatase (HAD superfamily)